MKIKISINEIKHKFEWEWKECFNLNIKKSQELKIKM